MFLVVSEIALVILLNYSISEYNNLQISND